MKKIITTLCLLILSSAAFSQCYPKVTYNCINPSTMFTYTYYASGTYNTGSGTCTGTSGPTSVNGLCGYSNVNTGVTNPYPACYYQAHGLNNTNAQIINCAFQAGINTGLIFMILAGLSIGGIMVYRNEKLKTN